MIALHGHCPACGKTNLVVTKEGELVCTNVMCPRPRVLNELISQRQARYHIIRAGDDADGVRFFTIKHPLLEWIDGLLDCDVHGPIREHIGATGVAGTYWCRKKDDGWEFLFKAPVKVETR